MIEYTRNQATARETAGVLVAPGHWAAQTVHAFQRWRSDQEVETWCGLMIDVSSGGAHTTDLITCLGCPQASLRAFRGAS